MVARGISTILVDLIRFLRVPIQINGVRRQRFVLILRNLAAAIPSLDDIIAILFRWKMSWLIRKDCLAAEWHAFAFR